MNNANLLARTQRAIQLLETRKKAVVKEHSERIKRLQKASDLLVRASLDEQEHGLVDVGPVLDPELLALIDAPDEGL